MVQKKAEPKKENPSAPKKPLWVLYRLQMDFVTKLCASVPGDPELVKKFLESRAPKAIPPGGRPIEEIQEEVLAMVDAEAQEEVQASVLVFQRVNGELCQRAATVRAHIKDCARVLGAQYIGRVMGERAFSTCVINGCYTDEKQYWLPIISQETGNPFTEASGFMDKPVHARGPRGQPINALKRFEYVLGARLVVNLKILGDSVKQSGLDHVFRYGGVHGYGGERSDGEGKYTYSLEKTGEEI